MAVVLAAAAIPAVDLSEPGSAAAAVRACEDLGFFKLTGGHGVPPELVARLEEEAARFFSSTQEEKQRAAAPSPSPDPCFGYRSNRIGSNGDVGRLEYLLLDATPKHAAADRAPPAAFLGEPAASSFLDALKQYTEAMRKLAGEVLKKISKGMDMSAAGNDALSKLVMDEESDCVLRLNHYPPPPPVNRRSIVAGFGEHTDPQIISILRSNQAAGLEIALPVDGGWVSVPSDMDSFFVNVGDCLQVLTNGRLKSVRHRVVLAEGDGQVSRASMVYFAGPPPGMKVAPLPGTVRADQEGEQSKYVEFTWKEYKSSAYKTRLADNRLASFTSPTSP